MTDNTRNQGAQTIEVGLKPGYWVVVMDDVSIEEGDGFIDGFTASNVFEGKVERFVPEANLLEFENSDMGYAEFMELTREHNTIEVIRE
jgi:hypothetical protein